MASLRILITMVFGIWCGAITFAVQTGQAHAAEINWNEYMQSSYLVAAIAAAMSQVEHCSKKPLVIEEVKDGNNKRSLVFTCAGTEDEETSSILHIERIGDGPWMPKSFDLAG